MHRLRLVIPVLLSGLLFGCADRTAAVAVAPGRIPGITTYVAQVTAPHRRAVRKPVRDARALALRHLAANSEQMLADSDAWDSEGRLAALAESQRPAACAAVAELREALREIQTAAGASDLPTLRAAHAQALGAYQRLDGMLVDTQ